MSYIPKAGDTVYSHDGAMALYVSTAKGGGYIVQPLIEDGDGISEPEGHYADGVEIWHSVYPEPPQPKLAAEIAAQVEELAALRREVADLERQKYEATRDGAALKERLAMHQALAVLDDLLSGKVTHYVIDSSEHNNGQWQVIPAADAHKLRTHYSMVGLRLWANLNHSTGRGGVQWKFSPQAETSRDERNAYAFTSEEAARAKVVELVTAEIATLASHGSNSYWLRNRIQWARSQGVEPPAEAVAKMASLERQEAEAAAAKAREALAKAEATLAATAAA